MSRETTIHPTVAKFLALLSQANAVIADSPVLSHWETSDATGDATNQVVRFAWEDRDDSFSVILTEGAIANGQWVGDSFFCLDHEGDEVHITLYKHVPIVTEDEEINDEEIDAMHAWSISSRLAAVPDSYLSQVPAEVANLIREAKTLHPRMAACATEREAKGEACPHL